MIKTIKIKRAYDLSMMTIIFMFTCNFFWLLNGIYEESISRMMAGALIMIISVIMFTLKIRYGKES